MPVDQDFKRALEIVQLVISSPAFLEFSADPGAVLQEQQDPVAALRARGISVPPEFRRVVAKRRHPTQVEWDRSWRSGGVEWQFFVEAGEKRFRFNYICDPWARDLPAAAGQPGAHAAANRHEHHAAEQGAGMAKDPVCGMDVDPATAPARAEHQGQTYYFCAPGCKTRFERDPAKYVGAGTH